MNAKTMLSVLAVGASLLASPAMAQPISAEQIKKIVASPERSAADRTNDLRRHPEQILEFIAIRPGIIALDVSAGGGYTTELLARSIGPTGQVYGQSRPRNPDLAPTAPQSKRNRMPPGLPGRGGLKSMQARRPWRTSMPHSSRTSRRHASQGVSPPDSITPPGIVQPDL